MVLDKAHRCLLKPESARQVDWKFPAEKVIERYKKIFGDLNSEKCKSFESFDRCQDLEGTLL